MTFDWLRFPRSVPTRDAQGRNRHQRPVPVITRLHAKRPVAAPQVVPQVRRVHHHQSPVVQVPRTAAPKHRGPVVRAPTKPVAARPPARPPVRPPARPLTRSLPPHRSSSKLLQCLHIHLHPSQKRGVAIPAPRSTKHLSSNQVPPFPPPRGAVKPPPRHVHWAPAQAPLPQQPYPYPSHSSSGSSRTHSHGSAVHYHIPVPVSRYQPPPPSRRPPQPPMKRR